MMKLRQFIFTPPPTKLAHGRRAVSSGRSTRWYYAAALALLMVAAFLRFYQLPASDLGFDEAVVANNSAGSLYETLHLTRLQNSSPILYPLALYGIQKIERSHLTIRLIPATASVLTVAALLFLLPQVGIPRKASFIAALLAAVSAEAIFHAQENRVYSVDALLAVLLIAGLLSYLRDGRKVLLSAALFFAPLVQYGLVILGVALLATAAIALRGGEGAFSSSRGEPHSYKTRIRAWLKARLDLVVPGVSLLAGSVVTWMATLAGQFHIDGFGNNIYLDDYYFDRGVPLSEALSFAASRIWDTLTWHLPDIVVPLLLAALGMLLLRSVARRRVHPILLLILLTLALNTVLALSSLYPLGATRQTIYLSPLLFLTAGLAFAETAEQLAAAARKKWLGPALLAGLGLLIALAGFAEIRAEVYARRGYGQADFYAALKERLRPDDAVYAAGDTHLRAAFYYGENPVWHSHWYCNTRGGLWHGCERVTVNQLLSQMPAAQRIWLLQDPAAAYWLEVETLRTGAARGKIELVAVDDAAVVYLMRDTSWLVEEYQARQEKYRAIAAGVPRQRAEFDLYAEDNTLYLLKEPCTAADVASRFLMDKSPQDSYFTLDIFPIGRGDRDEPRGEVEYRWFYFHERGAVFDGKCLASTRLPDYPIAEVKITRFRRGRGPVWASSIDLKADYYSSAYREIVAGEPAARGGFDLYLKDDRLYYYKGACSTTDRAGRFMLHFVPVVAADLPAARREYGSENRDFDFAEYGAVFDGKCMAAVGLPDYPVAAIRTGQFVMGAEQLWETEFYLDLAEHYRAAYPAVTANPPAAREGFDLYLEADRLHYVKKDCSAADTAARFLLHFIPVVVSDLPAERQEYGSENRDFDFAERGAMFDGKCMATVGLPDYPLAAIRTGQFVMGKPPLWTVELAVGAAAGSR